MIDISCLLSSNTNSSPYCPCWRTNAISVILYDEYDGQVVSLSIFHALVENTCLGGHVSNEAPGRLSGHSHSHRYGQYATHDSRGKELMFPAVQGDAVTCQYLAPEPVSRNPLQKRMQVTAVRGEHPIGRLDVLEDADKLGLVAPRKVYWCAYLARLEEGRDILLEGDQVSYG